MTREGASDETIAALAPAFVREGYTIESTARELVAFAQSARAKYGHRERDLEAERASGDAPGGMSDEHGPKVAQASSYPFKVTLFSEIAEEHVKEWLIDDLLGAGEYTCWYGAPGSRKSAIVGDAAAHVAAGLPWFGREVKCGAVLYVAAERGNLVKRRLAAWRKHHGVCDIPLAVLEGAFALCKTADHAKAIIRFASEAAESFGQPVVWVIIDTKAQVLNGANPNADEDIADFNGRVGAIMAATGAHVTVVDHVPHTEPNRMKGSGALAGAVDGSFQVRKEGQQSLVTIGSKPPNDGPDELELVFGMKAVQLGMDAKGKPTFAPVIVPVSTDMRLDPNRPSAGSPGRSLPAAAQKVLTAFGRLLDEERDVDAPLVPGVKPGTRAVAVHELRAKAFDIGLCAAEEPGPAAGDDERKKFRDTRKKAWKRALERLERPGLLRIEAGFAWRP
jgi:hypothetical protein